MSKQAKERHRWRENIEALTMAVVIALLFKTFILEVSKIPSGSMQPTLMGSPETSIFDRILVDKLSLHGRDPRRFEIVVFRHPLEQSRIMVKRVCGMPDEELEIRYGDLWVRAGEGDEWHVQRRPEAVQREMWKRLDLREPERSSWSVVSGGEDWRLTGRDVLARGDGRIRFRDGQGPIRDGYADGYPDSLRAEIAQRDAGQQPVGDVRLEGRIQCEAGTRLFAVELTEGPRTYRFELPGPAADEGAAPSITVRTPDGEERQGVGPYRLPAGRAVRFAVENLDDRLALSIGGQVGLTRDVEPAEVQDAYITLAIEGEGAELTGLMPYRDIYYLPQRNGHFEIPPGHYVMLGDNTQDSADSRDWRAIEFAWTEDGESHEEIGNFRPGARPDDAPNPVRGTVDGVPWTGFRDRFGERHWFPKSEGGEVGLPRAEPLVARELIQGRAIAVFWPLKPGRQLWRLGWLH